MEREAEGKKEWRTDMGKVKKSWSGRKTSSEGRLKGAGTKQRDIVQRFWILLGLR